MSESLPVLPGDTLPFKIGDCSPATQPTTVTVEDDRIAVERRIRLGDFSSAGTLTVSLDTRRLGNIYEILALPVSKVMTEADPFRKDAAAREVVVGWENGRPAHTYLKKNFFPFNKSGEPLDRPSSQVLTLGRMAKLEVSIKWDDDSNVEMDVSDQLHDELKSKVYDPETGGYSEKYWKLLSDRLGQLTLNHADPRARTQPLVLQIAGRTFGSIPNQEDVMMQQGLFSTADYDGFAAPEMPQNFDKLTPESPDPDEFWGSPLIVPFNLDVLRGIRLAFPQLPRLANTYNRISTQTVLASAQSTDVIPIVTELQYNELNG